MKGIGTKLKYPKKLFTKAQVLHARDKQLSFGERAVFVNEKTGKKKDVGWVLGQTSKSWVLTLKQLRHKEEEELPVAKLGKNGPQLKMSRNTEFELSQKIRNQDSMFR
jgi:hypothetical protein